MHRAVPRFKERLTEWAADRLRRYQYRDSTWRQFRLSTWNRHQYPNGACSGRLRAPAMAQSVADMRVPGREKKKALGPCGTEGLAA